MKDRASFDTRMFEPLAQNGLLQLTDGPGFVLPGVWVQPVHGHTPYMQTVRVATDRGTVYYPADLFPTGAHVPPAYGMAYDNQPLVTVDEKLSLYDQMIDEQWVVVFEHDALRQAATVIRGPKGPQLGPDISL
jgi:glyoxylase-like metal-dependent hydrolase (beta-lactamase superfamily II)